MLTVCWDYVQRESVARETVDDDRSSPIGPAVIGCRAAFLRPAARSCAKSPIAFGDGTLSIWRVVPIGDRTSRPSHRPVTSSFLCRNIESLRLPTEIFRLLDNATRGPTRQGTKSRLTRSFDCQTPCLSALQSVDRPLSESKGIATTIKRRSSFRLIGSRLRNVFLGCQTPSLPVE